MRDSRGGFFNWNIREEMFKKFSERSFQTFFTHKASPSQVPYYSKFTQNFTHFKFLQKNFSVTKSTKVDGQEKVVVFLSISLRSFFLFYFHKIILFPFCLDVRSIKGELFFFFVTILKIYKQQKTQFWTKIH